MCSRIWLITLVLISAASSANAGQIRTIGDPARDMRQTMQARKLLAADPDLASLNIGVVVIDRVATLWGPVPSAEAAFRAELCLRTMIELADVRNKLFVSELLDPMRVPLKIDIPPTFLPDRVPPKLPAEPILIPAAPSLLIDQARAEVKSATTKANKLPMQGLPEVDDSVEAELAAAIRTFLQSKSAYRAVQFTLKGRRVYLKSADQDTDTLHEAARGISRLPNVEGVILSDKMPPR